MRGEARAWKLRNAAERGSSVVEDNIWGMRRFRDGVLQLSRTAGKDVISSKELKAAADGAS